MSNKNWKAGPPTTEETKYTELMVIAGNAMPVPEELL